jgi:hypothetical protein
LQRGSATVMTATPDGVAERVALTTSASEYIESLLNKNEWWNL